MRSEKDKDEGISPSRHPSQVLFRRDQLTEEEDNSIIFSDSDASHWLRSYSLETESLKNIQHKSIPLRHYSI